MRAAERHHIMYICGCFCPRPEAQLDPSLAGIHICDCLMRKVQQAGGWRGAMSSSWVHGSGTAGKQGGRHGVVAALVQQARSSHIRKLSINPPCAAKPR